MNDDAFAGADVKMRLVEVAVEGDEALPLRYFFFFCNLLSALLPLVYFFCPRASFCLPSKPLSKSLSNPLPSYSPEKIAAYWEARPLSIVRRIVQLLSIAGGFLGSIAFDVAMVCAPPFRPSFCSIFVPPPLSSAAHLRDS